MNSKEQELYQYIVDISWEPYVYNYIELIYNKAQTLEKDSVNRSKLMILHYLKFLQI